MNTYVLSFNVRTYLLHCIGVHLVDGGGSIRLVAQSGQSFIGGYLVLKVTGYKQTRFIVVEVTSIERTGTYTGLIKVHRVIDYDVADTRGPGLEDAESSIKEALGLAIMSYAEPTAR